MIAYIEGPITFKDPTYVVVDVGGIGYEVKISLSTYSNLKDSSSTRLHTHLHIKEDAHTLYGFSDIKEKKLFLHLISISGVGPSTGLMILSSLSAQEIKQAIVYEDVNTIQKVKGVGAKTAQRIILELKDKMKKELGDENVNLAPKSHNTVREEALTALITLGINKAAAEKSVERILKNSSEQISLEELIKLALKSA
ncbi:Holliday junction branch migration protein RuvA [Fulvivirgaceae bacterium BMA10]|uniref:Holliday junction branch migration complex subunit RuvA n=1 Tax=Splendidivirga corallicola TaxID=3051826 RepID=A0ABT8KVU8_9BACT|nr:Holliday junction branch migration protein RuvA [Fulvivirgaceae bacterium BMA10]